MTHDDPFAPPPPAFRPSKYQAAILNDVGLYNMIIQAVAGSGKSKTLEEICGVINKKSRRASTKLVAFNKPIANELKERGLPASTLNGLGFYATNNNIKTNVNTDKLRDTMFRLTNPRQMKMIGSQVRKLVEKAYTVGLVPDHAKVRHLGLNSPTYEKDNPGVWEDLCYQFDIDFEVSDPKMAAQLLADTIDTARDVMADMIANTSEICLDDQINFPVWYDYAVRPYDNLLVDETQDVNIMNIWLIQKFFGIDTWFAAVGDRNQSLYQFRGAAADAMDRVGEMFNCRELPLSICYRCPEDVVRLAQKYVPQIEWNPDHKAGKGKAEFLTSYRADVFKPGDLIVSAKNADLVAFAYKLLAARIPCTVLGRDLASGMIALLNKIGTNYAKNGAGRNEMEFLILSLTAWKDAQVSKAKIKDDEDKIQRILDQYDTVTTIIDSSDAMTIEGIIHEFHILFAEGNLKSKVVLSSIHRAKGGEARRVFWLEYKNTPAKWATSDEQKFVENCKAYVATTRAQEELYHIEMGGYQS